MSLCPDLPAGALALSVASLVPLILPIVSGDSAAALNMSLEWLSEYNPRSARELSLAGEAIGFGVRGLAMLARSAAPGAEDAAVEHALKWASSLSRSADRASRRLDDLQHPRLTRRRGAPPAEQAAAPLAASPEAATPDTGEPCHDPSTPQQWCEAVVSDPAEEPDVAWAGTPGSDAAPPSATIPDGTQADADAMTAPPGEVDAAPPDPGPDAVGLDVAEAEGLLRTGEKLVLMKARHKGAPPAHTKAAQQIRAQERAVAFARVKLQQALARRAGRTPQQAVATA